MGSFHVWPVNGLPDYASQPLQTSPLKNSSPPPSSPTHPLHPLHPLHSRHGHDHNTYHSVVRHQAPYPACRCASRRHSQADQASSLLNLVTGMNVAAGPELAAAVSNAGGLGVIGGIGYTPKMLRSQVRASYPVLHGKIRLTRATPVAPHLFSLRPPHGRSRPLRMTLSTKTYPSASTFFFPKSAAAHARRM